MDVDLLLLKWNSHRTSFLSVIRNLRDKALYTDVTLACDGKFYPAHRLVLSACSEYFFDIFEQASSKNLVVVLKDIDWKDLEYLLEYMYIGKVHVKQNELASLIGAAECLKIKGIAVPEEDPAPKFTSNNKRQSLENQFDLSPPSKKKRNSKNIINDKDTVTTSKSSSNENSELADTVCSVKHESHSDDESRPTQDNFTQYFNQPNKTPSKNELEVENIIFEKVEEAIDAPEEGLSQLGLSVMNDEAKTDFVPVISDDESGSENLIIEKVVKNIVSSERRFSQPGQSGIIDVPIDQNISHCGEGSNLNSNLKSQRILSSSINNEIEERLAKRIQNQGSSQDIEGSVKEYIDKTTSSFFEFFGKEFIDMKANMCQLMDMMKPFASKDENDQISLGMGSDILQALPIRDVVAFKNFNATLDNDEKKKNFLISFYMNLGGGNYKLACRNIMGRTLSHDFALKMSFTGKSKKCGIKEKTKFKGTTILQCITIALQKAYRTKEYDITKAVMTWFHQACGREGGRANKTLFSNTCQQDDQMDSD